MSDHILPTDPPQPCPEYLTADEAVCYLRLDKMGIKNPKVTLGEWRMRGVLGGCRVSREFVYPRKELDAFMDQLLEGPRGT